MTVLGKQLEITTQNGFLSVKLNGHSKSWRIL